VTVLNGVVWASVYDRGVVAKVDPATGRIVRRVRVGGQPREFAFDGTNLWVVNQASSSVSRFAP
jgi:DNA-binding beta-propeller fold protein YncE